MFRLPNEDGDGFTELALVLILVFIVLVVILVLLAPEITAFLERLQAYFSGT